MAVHGYVLFVCEDGRWSLAKRYGRKRQLRATSDARLSLCASGVTAVRVLHQYVEPNSFVLRRELLIDVVKPGTSPPAPPEEAEPLGLANPRPALRNPGSLTLPTDPWSAIASRGSVYGRSQPVKAPLGLGQKLALIGTAAVIGGVAAIIALSSHLDELRHDKNPLIYLAGIGLFVAAITAVLAATASSKEARPTAERPQRPSPRQLVPTLEQEQQTDDENDAPSPVPADPAEQQRAALLEASRLSLLRFACDCFTNRQAGPYLRSSSDDDKRRRAFQLFIAGAAEACIAALPEPVMAGPAEIMEPALSMCGGNSQEVRDFLARLDGHLTAEGNLPLTAAGRNAMTEFLATKRVSITDLGPLFERWISCTDEADSELPAVDAAPDILAILFTDIVPTVDAGAPTPEKMAELVKQHDFIVNAAIQSHSGARIQHSGDGMMAVFRRVCDAIAAAAAIQGDIADANELGFGDPLAVRIGLAAGEARDQDTPGLDATIKLAAQLCAAAAVGTVMLPDALAEMPGCGEFTYSEDFPLPLKGAEEPVQVRMLLAGSRSSVNPASISSPRSAALAPGVAGRIQLHST